MGAYSDLIMKIDQRIYLRAARANVYGVLRDQGHEAATKAMGDVLDSMVGARTPYVEGGEVWTYFIAWEGLAVFTGERPTVKVKIQFKIDAAIYAQSVEIDATMLEPHNIPAMEVMWS
jgi:hypothetical protein